MRQVVSGHGPECGIAGRGVADPTVRHAYIGRITVEHMA
jgi:hypothetical protein